MAAISDADALVFLNATIRDKNILAMVHKDLHEPIFDPAINYASDYIMKVLLEESRSKEYTAIPYEALVLHVNANMLKENLDPMFQTSIVTQLNTIKLLEHVKVDPALVIQIGQSIQDNQNEQTADGLFMALRARSDKSHKAKLVKDIKRTLDGNTFGTDIKDSHHTPLLNYGKYLQKNKYWRTGIDFLDEELSGGFRSHEIIGFLAPTGGGKTVLTCQLAVNYAKQSPKHHVALFLYEQPPEGDITERLLTLVTGKHIDNFRGKLEHELDPEIVKLIEHNSKKFADRVHIFDYSDTTNKGCDGWDSIKRDLQSINLLNETVKEKEDADEEEPPVLVIIDWLIPFFKRSMTEGTSTVGEDLRNFGVSTLDYMKTEKTKYNCTIMLNHQLVAAQSGASASRTPQVSDAAEWKGMPQFTERFWMVGSRNEQNICQFVNGKNRTGEIGSRLIRMDGAFARFRDAENEFMFKGNKIIDKAQLSEEVELPPGETFMDTLVDNNSLSSLQKAGLLD